MYSTKCLSFALFLWAFLTTPLFAQTSLSIGFTTTNISCNGGADGCITVTTTGGGATLSYLWSNGASTSTICGLTAGNYTVTITDTTGVAGGGMPVITIGDTTVSQPFTLTTTIDSIGSVICTGNNNGFVQLSVAGGTMPYTYSWSNGATTEDINNLIDSIYTVVVTDTNGCTTTDTAVVQTLGFIAVTVDSTKSIACHGDSTGAIYTTATGDTSTMGCTSTTVALNEIMYNPTANDGQNPNTGEYIELIGPAGADISCYVLTDGDWTITIPPGTTIPSDGFFTIGNDIVWGAGTFDLDAENCNCFTDGTGGSGLLILTTGGEYVALYDGSGTFVEGLIYGTPTAGNSPNPGAIINTIGTAGCPSSVTIPATTAFETSIGGVANDVSLIRSPDGSGNWTAQVGGSLGTCNTTGSGSTGSGAVSYLWNTGATTQDITGLAAGTYTVTATNNYGCTATTSYTITSPAALIGTTTTVDIDCMGDSTGSIDLLVTGGTTPYQFVWSTGDTVEDLDSLASGIYCVTITDSNACVYEICDTIEEPFFSIPVDTFYSCMGDSVQLQVNTNATTIHWSPVLGLNNDTIANPLASPVSTTNYIVSASIGTGTCTMTDSILVIVDSLQVNLAASSNVSCHGDSTGSITTSSVGTGYQYLWNTGDTTAQLNNLPTGTYQLTVSNGGACQDTLTVVLTEPDSVLSSNLDSITQVLCFGDSTGAASIVAQGGTSPYTYSWSNGATTSVVSGLTAGFYNMTLTDANACMHQSSITITEPSEMTITYQSTNVSCYGTNDGTASVSVVGGTAGYSYLWDATTGSQTNATATGLPSSTYSVTITDTLGCTDIANSIFVGNATPIDTTTINLATLTGIIDCDLSPTGALSVQTANNYTYLWNTGATSQSLNNLAAGTYTVTITNGSGCTYVQSANIGSPFVPTVRPFITTIGVLSTTVPSGTTVTVSSGNDQSTQGVLYQWSAASADLSFNDENQPTTTALSNVAGTYMLTITATASDSNACQDSGTVVLTVESIYNGMPTAFTPNGDQVNDLYRPSGLTAEEVHTFRIYNRWGQEVYNGDNLENNGWDGRLNGVEQPTEVYLYLLEYKLGGKDKVEVKKGEFSLIR